MNKNKFRALAGITFVLGAGIAAMYVQREHSTPGDGKREATSTAGAAATPSTAPDSAATLPVATMKLRGNEASRALYTNVRTGATFPPLPPDNAPLRAVAETLHKQALAGNYRASCRLSYELDRCQVLPNKRKYIGELEKQLAAASADPQAKAKLQTSLNSEQKSADGDSEVCDGLVKSDLMKPWQYLFLAAQAGHLPSMVRFASTPPMDMENFANDLDGWTVYKQNSIALLEQAMDRGNTTALTELGWFYGGLPVMGGVVVERDRVKGIQFTQAALRLSDPAGRAQMEKRIASISRGMTPAEVLEAKTLGDDLYTKKFPGRSNVDTAAPLHAAAGEDCKE